MLTATQWLLPLLYGAVKQWDDIHRVTFQSRPRASDQHALNENYVYTAPVQGGKVVSEDGVTTAFAQGLPGVLSEQVDIIFSAFGTSSPVSAPPVSDVAG
jgi:hypothetical protein